MAVGGASDRPDPLSTWAKGALRVTRRPDTSVSPNGHPGPERRDLIGACTGDVTRHSIVRSPRRVGSERDSERSSTDVMMTDAEKAATEVILGVDTHLDVHVAVALDHLGREAWAS